LVPGARDVRATARGHLPGDAPDMPSPTRSIRLILALAFLTTVTGSGTATVIDSPVAARQAAAPTSSGQGAVSGIRSVVPRATIPTSGIPAIVPTRSAVAPVRPWAGRAATIVPAPTVKSIPTASKPAPAEKTTSRAAAPKASKTSTRATSAYRGRNHVWIPALGVDRSVSFFSCSSSAYPGNRVYRWGCAGRNNIYLFGHAASVFKPLHDSYVRGRLRRGMKVTYADGNGRVSTYAVAWWRVVTPDKGAFAFAGQSRPSITLQTCVGARSQYRLVVRLLKVS